MKRIMTTLLLFSCITAYAQLSIEEIRTKNPSKIQVIFEVERHADIEPEVWQYLIDCILNLYTPTLTSDQELNDWVTRFNDTIKKVAQVSVKTSKTQGRINFRFITD